MANSTGEGQAFLTLTIFFNTSIFSKTHLQYVLFNFFKTLTETF